jgi:hypothetical protein
MKKMLLITVVLVCGFLILFFAKTNDLMADSGGFPKYKLTRLWETKTDLRVPESVLYNPS